MGILKNIGDKGLTGGGNSGLWIIRLAVISNHSKAFEPRKGWNARLHLITCSCD